MVNNSQPPGRNGLPRHVAIIMDGNGRWAQRRGLLRIKGHIVGVESVRVIARLARKLGIILPCLPSPRKTGSAPPWKSGS